MNLRRIKTKAVDYLRQIVKFELTLQEKCTLFIMAIVAVHVGGIIWILIADENKFLP